MKLVLQQEIKFNEDEQKFVEDLGYEISYYNNEETEAEVLVGMLRSKYDEINNIKGLKFIQSTIAGFDMLDMDFIKERNIAYSNASGMASTPIAEYVVLKILDFFKDANRFRELQKEARWEKGSYPNSGIEELTNKTILVLGTGQIGQAIALRLKAFGVTLIGINSSGRAVDNFDETAALKDVYKHLSKADVVVGALPLNDDTREFYNKAFFDEMKDGSIFINVGRGPSLKEEDLYKALDKNIAHAYLDVTPTEPLESDSKLWSHPKISITPHVSAHSSEVDKRTTQLILNNLENYAKNKELINKVN